MMVRSDLDLFLGCNFNALTIFKHEVNEERWTLRWISLESQVYIKWIVKGFVNIHKEFGSTGSCTFKMKRLRVRKINYQANIAIKIRQHYFDKHNCHQAPISQW